MTKFSNTFVKAIFLLLGMRKVQPKNKSKFMRPDHPFKIFADQRNNYVFLLESLAADSFIF